MQVDVEHRLRQERSAQSARDEERNETDGEQHRRLEADSAATNRPQPVECLDGRGHADAMVMMEKANAE